MSDSMFIEGKEYISSKRASGLSGYAQDYIGQLARKGLIAAQRVGGLWFVSMASLTEYKSNADTYVPQPPEKKEVQDPDSLVSFDGRDHVSASRAAKITGYHPDYVGQLARSGAIISRQVGNRWYVDREAIVTHKQQKDKLLGAVQAQSVGIAKGGVSGGEDAIHTLYNGPGPFLTYTRDDRDLLPVLSKTKPILKVSEDQTYLDSSEDVGEEYTIPIRVLPERKTLYHTGDVKRVKSRGTVHGKTIYYGTFRNLATAALTIVIVLSFGLVTLKNSSVYTTAAGSPREVLKTNMLAGGAAAAFEWITKLAADFFAKELVYKRVQ